MLWMQTKALIAKDLRREWRTKEVTTTTVAFAFLLTAMFSFAFYVDEKSTANVFPGILWISVAFTSTLAITRTFVQEKDGGCLRALALVPGTQSSLYLAKFFVNLLFVAIFEVILIPALVGVFNIAFFENGAAFIAIVIVGTFGFVALGTLVAAMMVHNHMRDVMLPILLYPLAIPLLIGSVVVTKMIVSGEAETVWQLIRVIGAMDVAYFVVSLLLFRWILRAIE